MKVVGVDTIDDALRALRENGGAPVEQVAPKPRPDRAWPARTAAPPNSTVRDAYPWNCRRRFNTMAADG